MFEHFKLMRLKTLKHDYGKIILIPAKNKQTNKKTHPK